jgi:hypothetical protein
VETDRTRSRVVIDVRWLLLLGLSGCAVGVRAHVGVSREEKNALEGGVEVVGGFGDHKSAAMIGMGISGKQPLGFPIVADWLEAGQTVGVRGGIRVEPAVEGHGFGALHVATILNFVDHAEERQRSENSVFPDGVERDILGLGVEVSGGVCSGGFRESAAVTLEWYQLEDL